VFGRGAVGGLGIGVVTFNRPSRLKQTLEAVARHAVMPYHGIVADDGSSDETHAWLIEAGIPFVTGSNRGVAWNKNRALFYLGVVLACDWVIILEDDCSPILDGWELPIVAAIERYGHIGCIDREADMRDLRHVPPATPSRPYACSEMSAQCNGYSREALNVVGFMDSRFGRYGHEHVEHTARLIRAGYGGEVNQNGQQWYVIDAGIKMHPEPSWGSSASISQNAVVAANIAGDPIHRWPWTNDEDMREFRREQHNVTPRSVSGFPFTKGTGS
jgi:glycosyltransferase involved in cell wall biosynthesis